VLRIKGASQVYVLGYASH